MTEARRADARLDPKAVAARLEVLRRTWVALDADEARRLMTPPPVEEAFAEAAARRLEELRALDALTRHLHAPAGDPVELARAHVNDAPVGRDD